MLDGYDGDIVAEAFDVLYDAVARTLKETDDE